jgi:hypothetical protein
VPSGAVPLLLLYAFLEQKTFFSFIIPKELLVQEIHTTIRMVLTHREK